MPSLQRFVLDISTQDKDVVDGEKFIKVLPLSLIEIHLFIMYHVPTFDDEKDPILSTWPSYVRVIRLLHESNRYGVIYTVPCDLFSMVIPAYVASNMMVGSKYTQKVQYLKISGKQCSNDIHKIVQHFHQLGTLSIGSSRNSHASRFFAVIKLVSFETLCEESLTHYEKFIEKIMESTHNIFLFETLLFRIKKFASLRYSL